MFKIINVALSEKQLTEDKASVESKLAGLGYDMECTSEESLRYSYLMTAVRTHPLAGEMVWSNQSSVYNYAVGHGRVGFRPSSSRD